MIISHIISLLYQIIVGFYSKLCLSRSQYWENYTYSFWYHCSTLCFSLPYFYTLGSLNTTIGTLCSILPNPSNFHTIFQNKAERGTTPHHPCSPRGNQHQGNNPESGYNQGGYQPGGYHQGGYQGGYYECQYPGQQYYNQYHTGDYNAGYRRPYDQYGYTCANYEQNYGYHHQYRTPPPRQAPPPPPPPRSREYPPTDPDYRRESFSSYSHPPKRSRSANPEGRDRDYPYYEPVSPPRATRSKSRGAPRSSTPVKKHTRSRSVSDAEYSDEDRNLSRSKTHGSVESITSLLDRSTLESNAQKPGPIVPSFLDESMEESEDTDIKISEKEKKDYFTRLELVYHTLDEYLELPEPQQQKGTSLARGKVVVKVKPTSLPPSSFVQTKFDEYHAREQKSIKKVDIKKPKDQADQKEPAKVKVLSNQKPMLGFDKNPFRPSWLYVIDKPDWPDKVQPEEDITLLTADGEAPYDAFLLTRKEMYKIQQASSNIMNAACYVDWKMAALRKLVAAAQHPDADQEAHLNAIEDLLDGTAYCNEYITDQSIYIHGGITHKMRKDYLAQMEDLTPSEYENLLSLPYDTAAVFNGQIPYIVKNITDRETRMAMRKMAQNQQNNQNRQNNIPPGRPRRRPNRNRTRNRNRNQNQNQNQNNLTPFLQRKYTNKSNSSKGGPRNNQGGFHQQPRFSKSKPNWNKAYSNYQAFQGRNNQNKPKRSFHQQGNRNFNRDFN